MAVDSNGHVWVYDLDSTHGTRLADHSPSSLANGKAMVMLDGDVLVLGAAVYSQGKTHLPVKLRISYRTAAQSPLHLNGRAVPESSSSPIPWLAFDKAGLQTALAGLIQANPEVWPWNDSVSVQSRQSFGIPISALYDSDDESVLSIQAISEDRGKMSQDDRTRSAAEVSVNAIAGSPVETPILRSTQQSSQPDLAPEVESEAMLSTHVVTERQVIDLSQE